MNKRSLLLFVLGFCTVAAAVRADDMPFDFDTLRYQAKLLAIRPYLPQPQRIPESLQKLTYDRYRDIRFKPEKAWWRREALPFQLQFFHPGFFFNKTVQISEVIDKEPKSIPFE